MLRHYVLKKGCVNTAETFCGNIFMETRTRFLVHQIFNNIAGKPVCPKFRTKTKILFSPKKIQLTK